MQFKAVRVKESQGNITNTIADRIPGDGVRYSSLVCAALLSAGGLAALAPPCWAAGKGSSHPSVQVQAQAQTPRPFRPAQLRSVGTRPFQLPNGSRVDLTADLDTMFSSLVTQQTRFLPLEAGDESPECLTRIELRANVSTFDLNVADIGIHFGWTPQGEIGNSVTQLNGKTQVKIGTISMDFGVWQCTGSRCVEMAATTATHLTAGVNLNLEVDFTAATTGAAFVWNTALSQALRGIMEDGLQKLERNARISKLNWYATVREVDQESGTLLFDAGTASALRVGDAFEVYARTPSLSACDVYKTVAAVRARRVDTRATLADMDASYDERGVLPGDIVLIREIPRESK
jgi:hypothetical protein